MNLEDFYHSINLATLDEFVRTGREEDLHLDFKLATQGMTNDAKRNFAKALSGFANSDGGIIVWGVNARKDTNRENIDAACGLEAILHLSKFINDLHSFTGQFVSPIVDKVQHKPLFEDQTKGYAVTLVPVSQNGPHMAMAGESRYYKRSGDSFYRLEHFDLVDLFGRRPQAALEFFARPMLHDSDYIDVVIGIKNIGRGLARFPYLSVNVPEPFSIAKYGLDGNHNLGLPRIVEHDMTHRKQSFGGSADIVIYPNSTLSVTKIRFNYKKSEVIPDLVISYSMCCEGVQMTSGVTTVVGYPDLQSVLIK